LRAIAILRDGGCVLRFSEIQMEYGIKECSGWRQDGELILQYDHLKSRQFNVSFADIRLGVILCKGHHGWKHFTDANKKLYDRILTKIVGPERAALWERVENYRKTYLMTLWDWQKVEMALKQELVAQRAA